MDMFPIKKVWRKGYAIDVEITVLIYSLPFHVQGATKPVPIAEIAS